jgi:hypothetical protein
MGGGVVSACMHVRFVVGVRVVGFIFARYVDHVPVQQEARNICLGACGLGWRFRFCVFYAAVAHGRPRRRHVFYEQWITIDSLFSVHLPFPILSPFYPGRSVFTGTLTNTRYDMLLLPRLGALCARLRMQPDLHLNVACVKDTVEHAFHTEVLTYACLSCMLRVMHALRNGLWSWTGNNSTRNSRATHVAVPG